MKKNFVLDLNIILLSCLEINEHGQPIFSSAFLLLNIIEKCHRIVVNDYLLIKYSEKTDEVKRVHRGAKVLNVINVIHQVMKKRNKGKFESDIFDVDFLKEVFMTMTFR